VGKILENMIVEDPEPESEVDEAESGPEVVELVSLQEEISSKSTKVEELSIETIIDLSKKPTTELVSSLATMRASLSLRSHDVYNPL